MHRALREQPAAPEPAEAVRTPIAAPLLVEFEYEARQYLVTKRILQR